MMHEWAHCCDEAASHQLPIAAAFWTIQIVSMEEDSSLTQNLMQICLSTHSIILNVMATQYTCSLNGVCCPHWLVQWSRHSSHTHITVHSPWLPGYSHLAQTILLILIMTMAGLSTQTLYIYFFNSHLIMSYACLNHFSGIHSSQEEIWNPKHGIQQWFSKCSMHQNSWTVC